MPATENHSRARLKSVLRPVVAVLAVLVAACIAHACSVPVFRYAHDHWIPDAYRIHVLHQGALTEAQADVVQDLQDQVASRFSNAVVEVTDVAGNTDPALTARYEQSESPEHPLCVVQTPTDVPDTYRDVWTGPLTPETADALLGSPVRDQLVKLLLEETSVVWIYLDSGVTPIDDANFQLLETELARLQGVIELPEIDPADLKELSTSPDDIKLQFSALRLSRDNAEEAALIDMLLSSEPDLRDATFLHEPMAFPVFGRGRVLYSLVGQGITADLIEDACRFLTGACQCTVKAQNPGVDLLLSVDWDGLMSPAAPTEVDVTLTGLAGFQSDGAQTPAAPTSTATSVPAASESAPVADLVATADAPSVDTPSADVDPAPPAAPTNNEPVIARRPQAETATATRPIVLITMLGLVVVVASFFLIPRR